MFQQLIVVSINYKTETGVDNFVEIFISIIIKNYLPD